MEGQGDTEVRGRPHGYWDSVIFVGSETFGGSGISAGCYALCPAEGEILLFDIWHTLSYLSVAQL